mmetsp:Transcript_28096/g.74134  ORF Transcript_28096/g.74134 Transcript_28096/m.74134 type:complete len:251 (-) Transcript_28096:539-1291(-)
MRHIFQGCSLLWMLHFSVPLPGKRGNRLVGHHLACPLIDTVKKGGALLTNSLQRLQPCRTLRQLLQLCSGSPIVTKASHRSSQGSCSITKTLRLCVSYEGGNLRPRVHLRSLNYHIAQSSCSTKGILECFECRFTTEQFALWTRLAASVRKGSLAQAVSSPRAAGLKYPPAVFIDTRDGASWLVFEAAGSKRPSRFGNTWHMFSILRPLRSSCSDSTPGTDFDRQLLDALVFHGCPDHCIIIVTLGIGLQ